MARRTNVNAFSKDIYKGHNQPDELFCNLPKPLNKIDDYVHESDRVCLDLKRDLLKRMQSIPQYTIQKSISLTDELSKRKRLDADYYLPGMPDVLMPVRKRTHKRQKKKTKTIDLSKVKGEGEGEGNSDEDKEKKDPIPKGKDSESEAEEQNLSNSSGEEAGDYADTYFDNGEDYLPSDNSGGDGDLY